MQKLLIATTNPGKIREFENLFQGLPIGMVALKSLTQWTEVPETGKTFSENALLKARGYALQCNLMTLAEDSGLCCDALEGAPGVYSARFAGELRVDTENNLKLLKLLKDLPVNCRGAYYESHVAIVSGDGDLIGQCSGRVHGVIHPELRGNQGFGYDALFFYPPMQKTFGEITLEEKNKISHRFHAMQKAREILANKLIFLAGKKV